METYSQVRFPSHSSMNDLQKPQQFRMESECALKTTLSPRYPQQECLLEQVAEMKQLRHQELLIFWSTYILKELESDHATNLKLKQSRWAPNLTHIQAVNTLSTIFKASLMVSANQLRSQATCSLIQYMTTTILRTKRIQFGKNQNLLIRISKRLLWRMFIIMCIETI